MSRGTDPIRVLHVDDDPAFADLTATLLERENDRFEVETATSADGGLDRIDDGDFDCIVSDYEMPGRDGIEFLEFVREDNPLVYANERFCDLTGYDEDAVLGRNCRFLQGEGTDPETVAEIRRAIDAEKPVEVTLRNYRADGTEFWNRVSIAPVYDDEGELTNYVGFQRDVTDRVERDREDRVELRADGE